MVQILYTTRLSIRRAYALRCLTVLIFSLLKPAFFLAAVAWSSTFLARLLSVLILWILRDKSRGRGIRVGGEGIVSAREEVVVGQKK